MPVVIDASAMLAWVLEEMDDAKTLPDLIAAEGGVAPANWALEVASTLQKSVRRGRILPETLFEALRIVHALDVVLEPPQASRHLITIPRLAEKYEIAAYDGAYLELAIRRELPLVTFDERLRRAAELAGVDLPYR